MEFCWTYEEDQILINNYKNFDGKIRHLLPYKTDISIKIRAYELGIIGYTDVSDNMVYIIFNKDGTVYNNKVYTNRDRALRIYNGCKSTHSISYIILPFIGRSVSYIYESKLSDPDQRHAFENFYYKRKIFACEDHAKKSDIWNHLINRDNASIVHIRVVKD